MANLSNCVIIVGLTDMRYKGNFSTWKNRQESRIASKLDRLLINVEWIGVFLEFEAKFCDKGVTFDHSSMIVYFVVLEYIRKRVFRFFSIGDPKHGYQQIGGNFRKSLVRGNPMYIFMTKLNAIRGPWYIGIGSKCRM